jgi:hypothetical protein
MVAAAMLVSTSCEKQTGLKGVLILQTGQTGDVTNCRVQLFVSSDLTGNPVKEVASQPGNTVRSEFEFQDLVPGYYYLLAWKDLNGDGEVSDRDIVGIHGGTYRPGYGGSQVTVIDGKTEDVGEIVMLIFKELKFTASGSRSQGGAVTDFSYTPNYDVTISRFSIVFPDEPGTEYEDSRQVGAKTGGQTYTSDGWNMGGAPMPTGSHILRFQGTWDGGAFDISLTINVS